MEYLHFSTSCAWGITMIELREVKPIHLQEMYNWELDKELQEKTGVEEPRTYRHFKKSLEAYIRGGKPNLYLKAIEFDGQLVGKVELFITGDRTYLGIVVAKYRESGIGSQALQLFLEDVKKNKDIRVVYVEVYEDNQGSLNFFEKNGFWLTGEKNKESFRGRERQLLLLKKEIETPSS